MTKQLDAWPVSGVNKFSGEVQVNVHRVVFSEEKSDTIAEEKLVTHEKVTPSEEVDKGTSIFNDI